MATYDLDYVKKILTNNGVTEFAVLQNNLYCYHHDELLRTFKMTVCNGYEFYINARDFDNWLFYMGYT